MPHCHPPLRSVFLICTLGLSACGDPPDETPLGREAAAFLARPEHKVEKVKVSQVLMAFAGAMRGSESGHTFEEARTLAEDVLKRARAGEDFEALMKNCSSDEGGGTYKLTQDDRDDYAEHFQEVAFRLEVGVAAYQPSKSPFGWHVIKRHCGLARF